MNCCMPFFKSRNSNQVEKRALLVGINYRGTSGELHGCINDINNIKSLLLKNGYKEENIRMMSDDHKELPTKHKIAMGLIWLMENTKNKNMELFFHYSGHGSWVYDKNGDEKDNRDECLVPIDYKRNGMLYDDDIKSLVEDNLTSNSKLFCIIDACHSGTMIDLKYNLMVSKVDKTESKINTEFKLETHNYEGTIKGQVIVISGCEDTQTSADAWLDRKSQGALTHSFSETMRNNNYELDFETLMTGVYQIVKQNNFTQNPTLSSNKTIVLENKVVV